jgi:hypothetical protein
LAWAELAETKVTDAGLKELARLKNLTGLHLHGTLGSRDKTIKLWDIPAAKNAHKCRPLKRLIVFEGTWPRG